MLPSDITGHAVLDAAGSGSGGTLALRVRRGPVFTNILLADEINRAPAKTQSALLEVMQEYQVTLEGETLAARAAVHRPGDAEPDRHRRHLSAARSAARPLPAEDRDRLSAAGRGGRRSSCARPRTSAGEQLPLGDGERVHRRPRAARAAATWPRSVRVDERVIDYAVRIVRATRGGLGLAAGSGPRGAIALVRAARAAALLEAATSSRPTTSSAAPCRRCATACCSRPTRSSKGGASTSCSLELLGDGRRAAALSSRPTADRRCRDPAAPADARQLAAVAALAAGRRGAPCSRGVAPPLVAAASAPAAAALCVARRAARRLASRRAWRAAPLRWQRAPAAGARGRRAPRRSRRARQRRRRALARRALRARRSVRSTSSGLPAVRGRRPRLERCRCSYEVAADAARRGALRAGRAARAQRCGGSFEHAPRRSAARRRCASIRTSPRSRGYAWLAGDRRLAEIGIKSYPMRGSGTDFKQLADYRPGDAIRDIDWKATLRHGRPIVREYQDERDQRVVFLLDCGRRMRADEGVDGAARQPLRRRARRPDAARLRRAEGRRRGRRDDLRRRARRDAPRRAAQGRALAQRADRRASTTSSRSRPSPTTAPPRRR